VRRGPSNGPTAGLRPRLKTLGLAGLVFVVLAIRFSPDWLAFRAGVQEAESMLSGPAKGAIIEQALLLGHAARGVYVARQAADLGFEIAEPNHKIIRWRLLMPAVAHVLDLPITVLFGLAPAGGVLLVWVLVGLAVGAGPPRSFVHPLSLALIAAAGAPLLTSLAWLGYYDAWLALALIAVALVRPRWAVVGVCLLAPWIDERFVVGLPLALWVRYLQAEPKATAGLAWFKAEAALPLGLACVYALVRIRLGGAGGSQTIGDYLARFVFAEAIPVTQRLFGAWEGLRFGWWLVAVALVETWRQLAPAERWRSYVLAAGVGLTGLVGLFTAQDMARSMMLLAPVVAWGLVVSARASFWLQRSVVPVLALLAVLLPAHHVIGRSTLPMANLGTAQRPLLDFQCDVGGALIMGIAAPRDTPQAARWFLRAAERGHDVAQFNLGLLYLNGNGVPRDAAAAAAWFRRAGDQGYALAQYNLGLLYWVGQGVPRDVLAALGWLRRAADGACADARNKLGAIYAEGAGVESDPAVAVRWFRQAADQDHAEAQKNLGVMYLLGRGVPQDGAAAAGWFHRAARQGQVDAESNLGLLYAAGELIPSDLARAAYWLRRASAKGDAVARQNLSVIDSLLTPAHRAALARLEAAPP